MKKTIFILSALFITAAVFTSCNELKKMVKNAEDVEYKAKPSPLEMHANKVPIDVSVTFPEKYFGKHVKLVITPVLKQDEGEQVLEFPTQTVIGEKFEDNYTVIPYKVGGTFRFTDTIEYADAYRMSDLNLNFQASDTKNKSAEMISVKLTDGIITTPELVKGGLAVDGGLEEGSELAQTVSVPVSKPAISIDTQMAKIFFQLQKDNVRRSEMSNEEVDSLISFIKTASADEDQELSSVKIKSYASPDGPVDLNQGLVEGRGKNTKSAFDDKLKREKVKEVENTEFSATETTPAEDWEGFKELVEASEIEDKELILKVLSMYDGEKREDEIKNMAAVYNELRKDILPKLRRSIIELNYQGREKTTEEMISLASSNPEKLNENELLYAAFSVEDLDQKIQLYTTFTNTYPEKWKGWNNLAAAQAKNGDLDGAKANFEKVLELKENNAPALNNLGVIELANGNVEEAWDYFTQAEEAGCKSPSLQYNMGVILIMQANYAQAVEKFQGESFNKALAQTLNDENDAAVTTLNAMNNSYALFYYLKAVTAAKADNEGDVYENLRIAVSKDAELKDYTKNDVEFRDYFDTQDFKEIVQ